MGEKVATDRRARAGGPDERPCARPFAVMNERAPRRFVPSFGLNLPEKAIVDGGEGREEREKFRPAASLFVPITLGFQQGLPSRNNLFITLKHSKA